MFLRITFVTKMHAIRIIMITFVTNGKENNKCPDTLSAL